MNEFLITLSARHRDDGSVFITCNEIPFINVVGNSEVEAAETAFRILKESLEVNYGYEVVAIRGVGEASDLIRGFRQSKSMPSHVIAQIAA